MPGLTNSTDPRRVALGRSHRFGDLPPEILDRLAELLETELIPAGETIVREGEGGDACYLIASGEAGVVGLDLIGQEVVLATLGLGDSFGEVAAFHGGPRSATIRALSDVAVYVITRPAFSWLIEASPEFGAALERYAGLLTADAFLKRASPFSTVSPEAIWRLAGQLRPVAVGSGEVIVREGEPGEDFYLVRSGRLEVTRRGRRIAVLRAGDCFGEVALIAADRRTATVRAIEPAQVFALSRLDFERVVREQGSFRAQVGELIRIRHGSPHEAGPAEPASPTTTLARLSGRPRRYWQFLIAGFLAFVMLSVVASIQGDATSLFFASLIGGFVGPVVFVTYLTEAGLLAGRPRLLAVTFVLGAAFGLPIAHAIEGRIGVHVGRLDHAIVIGVVEEAAKLLGIVWLLPRRELRFIRDGVIYGAAAGMGFAAIETVSYGFDAGLPVVWVRAVLSPFGHGTWTAITAGAIWHAKSSRRARDAWIVPAGFGVSVVLHALWDWLPLPGYWDYAWFVLVGLAGIFILRALVRRAVDEEGLAATRLNPDLIEIRTDRPRLTCGSCGQTCPPGTHYCVRCGSALRRA